MIVWQILTSKARSTDQKLDQQIKVRSIDQNLKLLSTDKNLDEYIQN